MLIYREGLFPFALLTATGVIAIAMIADPRGFSIRDWQTLLAAFVALGAATLTYRSAMAKVELDRTTTRDADRRKRLGLYVRLELALNLIEHEIETTTNYIAKRNTNVRVRSKDIDIVRNVPEFDEAWSNLDAYPPKVIEAIHITKRAMLNLERYQSDPLPESIPVCSLGPDVAEIEVPRFALRDTLEAIKLARRILDQDIESMASRSHAASSSFD